LLLGISFRPLWINL